MSLSSIQFGCASAEREYQDFPELLINGFLDVNQMIGRLYEGSEYLVLGNKGSGKSSLAKRMMLDSESDPLKFVSATNLEDFPYHAFARIMPGKIEPEAKYPHSWALLILLSVIGSFLKDEGLESDRLDEFYQTTKILSNIGVLSSASLKDTALKASKHRFKIDLWGFVVDYSGVSNIDGGDLRFVQIVETLKQIVRIPQSKSMHYIVIDGLDDILSLRADQGSALAALIYQTSELNSYFKRNCIPCKVIVLCRTDLYEKLPGPNKNKIRRDFSFHLNWYHDAREPKQSLLFDLANMRANLSLKRDIRVVDEYFPSSISGTAIHSWLLERTRHTPRDFLQLLNSIKCFSNGDRLSASDLQNGSRKYSIEYFLPEIQDEMVGYLSVVEIDRFLKLVGGFRKRYFSFEGITSYKNTLKYFNKKDIDLEKILSVLFDCSALGNVNDGHYTFRHRNHHARLNLDEKMVFHRGLDKALNLK